ncbi:hypothetical protein STCU_03822 [Strigomonas culicis]|nr:hypothetical protein STCU_03822 [Strigomonas culicis]|eukprot:EPY30881.1 hypothetical protein STCU_03822 [Strigomonas culicis]
MFSDGAVSFAIPAVERSWETAAKAKSCYNAAIIYAIFFAISVLARVYFRRNEVVTQMLRHSAHVEEVQGLLSGSARAAQ